MDIMISFDILTTRYLSLSLSTQDQSQDQRNHARGQARGQGGRGWVGAAAALRPRPLVHTGRDVRVCLVGVGSLRKCVPCEAGRTRRGACYCVFRVVLSDVSAA